MKPNVWKKISSVIIILIMMVRNVHTSSATCNIEIFDRAFQLMHHNAWLGVNQTSHKPQLIGMPQWGDKPRLCVLKPKDQINYYLYDINTHFFICAPPVRRDKSKYLDRKRQAVARRIPQKSCSLTEQWSGNSYMKLFGNENTTELRAARLGRKQRNMMVILMHDLAKIDTSSAVPRLREDSCEYQLRSYCRRIGRPDLRHKKHVREFQKTFCAEFCWTFV